MIHKGVEIKYLGHSTFLFRSVAGSNVLVDPWVKENPSCPVEEKNISSLDLMLITHGHFDHVSDAVELAEQHAPQVACIFELGQWLESKGVVNIAAMNKGGSILYKDIGVTMVDARHSSGFVEDDQIVYMGEAAGFVIEFENGFRVYHAGDTAVFGDMKLIGELYQPDLAILPIGDVFTMGPKEAAMAVELLGVSKIIPGHFATFPLLTGTPSELRKLLPETVRLIQMEPGQSISQDEL